MSWSESVGRWTVGSLLIAMVVTVEGAAAQVIDADLAGRFARLALNCVEREYPNKI